MEKVCEVKECSGCGSCASVCPKQCIAMEENKEGFLYPVIDESMCIDCGLCQKSCMVHTKVKTAYERKAYAMQNDNEEIRMNSSSGGVFSVLAEHVIQKKGVIYGAAFDEKYEVKHIRISDCKDIDKLRTSKYVQSVIGNCYKQAKQDLEEGRLVLFTGTPCQIGGLKGFLKKEYDNLYCQDIMCHGAPTPKLWRKYLNEISDGKIESVSFRDKTVSWSQFSMKIEMENQTIRETFYQNTYMQAFLADIALRESCSNCNYKELNYFSDVTLADFWGLDKAYPELDDSTGVSLVLANTPKGEQLLNQVSDMIKVTQVELERAVEGNRPAITNTLPHKNRKQFFDNLEYMTTQKLVKKYVKGNLLQKIGRKLFSQKG